MYCKNCGTEIQGNLNYCPKCGSKTDIPICNKVAQYDSNQKVVIKNKKTGLFLSISVFLVIFAVILTLIISSNENTSVWNDYLNKHQVDESAQNITYYIDGKNERYDFSCDLDTPKIISSQEYDIDEDGEEELLQVSVVKKQTDNQIYPSLQITNIINDEYITETYNFSDANFYVSSLFEGQYYLYKSNQSTYVLVEKDAPLESSQYYAAGVISQNHNTIANYSYISYANGNIECYDHYNDEMFLSVEDTDSAFALTQFSNLRTLFASLGIKGFLTGTDDIDNITSYNDIIPIGQFSVDINGCQGHIAYSDLLNQNR